MIKAEIIDKDTRTPTHTESQKIRRAMLRLLDIPAYAGVTSSIMGDPSVSTGPTKHGAIFQHRVLDASHPPLIACTVFTDTGGRIIWGKRTLEKLSDNDLVYILAHEIMHVALGHHWRLYKESQVSAKLANIVADYEVERSLRSLESEHKVRMPKVQDPLDGTQHDLGLRCPPHFEHSAAEEMFSSLYQQHRSSSGADGTNSGHSAGDHGDGTDSDEQGTGSGDKSKESGQNTNTGGQCAENGNQSTNTGGNPSESSTTLADLIKDAGPHGWVPVESEQDASKVRELLTDAIAQAQALENMLRTFEQSQKDSQSRGTSPGFLESVVQLYLGLPTQDWRQILRDWVVDSINVRLNWNKPAKQTWSTGVYIPKRNKKDPSAIILARDTSGSMSDETIGYLTSEILGICSEFGDELQYLAIDVDTDIRGYVLTRNPLEVEQFFCTARGRGGTEYQALWKVVKELAMGTSNLICNLDTEIIGTVMITDFETDHADLNPDIELPILWVSDKKLPRNIKIKGVVIRIPKKKGY
jgi:predicted metal-dependent peptidase